MGGDGLSRQIVLEWNRIAGHPVSVMENCLVEENPHTSGVETKEDLVFPKTAS